MDALNNEASIPARTAFKPMRAMSLRRFGAKLPNPPSKIPIEEILANPHSAKLTIATVLQINLEFVAQMMNTQQIRLN